MVTKKIGITFGIVAASFVCSMAPALSDFETGGMLIFKARPAVLAKTNVVQRFDEYAQLQPGQDDTAVFMVIHNGAGSTPGFDWVQISSPSMQTVSVRKSQFVNDEYRLDMMGKLGDGYNQLFVTGAGPAGASLSWCLLSPTPSVASLSATKISAGQKLTINGTNLPTSTEVVSVTIGGKKAKVLSATSSAVTVRVPAELSSGNSEVQLQFGTYSSTPLPVSVSQVVTLSGINAQTAAAGTTVVISGTNFSTDPSEDQVFVGPFQARVISATANQLTIQVPINYGNMFPQYYQGVQVQVRGIPAKNQLMLNVSDA